MSSIRNHSESGQVAVLVLGLALVAFAVAGIAVDGTRAFLYRRTLQNAADAAALSGAAEIDQRDYYASGGEDVLIDEPAARAEVRRMLGLRGIRVSATAAIDTGGVTVVLRGNVPTSFLGIVGIESIPVAVESRAEPFPGDAP